MKIGFCAGVEKAAEIKEWGFDFIELALAPLAQLNDEEFAHTLAVLRQSGLPCLACNVLLPGSIPVVGPRVDPDACRDYLTLALRRAASLGAGKVVFGSGGSRSVPGGFPASRALTQLIDFAGLAAGIAAQHQITIVLEPLNSIECNIVNRVSEALILAQAVNHPHFKVLADFYHMQVEQESLQSLVMAGADLRHVHIANCWGRKIPLAADAPQMAGLVSLLLEIGYTGDLSLEAGFRADQAAEARESLAIFHRLLA